MKIKTIVLYLVIVASSWSSCGQLGWADSSEISPGDKPILPLVVEELPKVKYGRSMLACRGVNSLNTTKKVVALTFDDGPHKKYTRAILDILRRNNIKATFFIIGKNAETYPDIVREIHLAGHVVANHSYSHYYLTNLSEDAITSELTKCSTIIHNTIASTPLLFRPPYGACSYRSSNLVKRLGFITIGWNVMVNDYDVKQTTPAKIATGILSYVKPGAIIGLHDGGGNREKTVLALSTVIDNLKSAGYEFLTVPELLNIIPYKR